MVQATNRTEQEIAQSIETRLSALCSDLDGINFESIEFEPTDHSSNCRFDAIARICVLGRPMDLVIEVKSNGQPRNVRDGVLKLSNAISASNLDARPVFIAPFLSEQSRQICKLNRTNYLDFAGNAYLRLPNLLVDISTANTPKPERRSLRSLFGTKASRLLRTMLKEPSRPWKVKELASVSDTSLGLASNVRRGLLNREWAQETHKGIVLIEPDLVLDAWCSSYRPNNEEISLYTTLHGKRLENAIRQLFANEATNGKVMYGSFSAARWIAPYGRNSTEFLYATPDLLDSIVASLNAVPVSQGGNVILDLTDDSSVLKDAIEPTAGIVCTSPLQTYLDLGRAGEQGIEAAEFLRRSVLTWGMDQDSGL